MPLDSSGKFRHNSQSAAMHSKGPGLKAAAPKPDALSEGPDSEDPHEVAAEHGPADEVHIEHDHAMGSHKVHSKHADGHEHHSEHESAGEAHDHAKALAGEGEAGPHEAEHEFGDGGDKLSHGALGI